MHEGGEARCKLARAGETKIFVCPVNMLVRHGRDGAASGDMGAILASMELLAARCVKMAQHASNVGVVTCHEIVNDDWSSTRYFHADHLNSTNVITNASGTAIQVLDTYPYGSNRINQTTGRFNEGKQFIAQYSDPETNLSYLQARYYDGSRGQFLSQDPVFWGSQNLTDPQSMNS
jgi:RHS repeat-associated protein